MMGEVVNVSHKKHSYNGDGMLAYLTCKQKAIFEIARDSGYYKYPRKISSESLAKRLKIKKSTLIEHLRRIENNIFNNL
jgi:predicted DNA binding protein